ncbi:acetylcholine receptor subunit alpha [Elysia marginata]|uniref:Acetylcholine receptor subunit alpha n=1 Tax=Elysia marginata TaxID=1093978 RepID=A0AAV4F0R9_9GAST|nr:acetylcholine receptor subunit alpha [Elysia marginata]
MGPVISRLRKKSDPDVMPTGKLGGPLEVSVTLNVINIASVDEERGEVELLVWQTMSWRDPDLSWWPSEHLNVTSVRIHPKYLWTPDITVFNKARASEEVTPRLASVDSDGTVTLLPSLRVRVLCDIFGMTTGKISGEEKTTCEVRLGSWTHSADILTLTEPDNPNLGTSGYFQGSQFVLLDLQAKKNSFYYPCCPEPFEDLKFFFTFRRKLPLYAWDSGTRFLTRMTRYN